MHKISLKNLLSDFLLALRGSNTDFTTGSINRAIFLLSIPMILEMVMEALFAIVDVYFVSKISVNAMVAVSLTENVLFIVWSIAIGLAIAMNAIIARRIGEKDYPRASSSAASGILVSALIAIIIGILGGVFAGNILELMGADAQVIQEGIGYSQIMFASNIMIILLFVNNGIIRGAGDASVAMKALIISNTLNIILDPILIFGTWGFPGMGVKGAALATVVGRGIGVIYQFYHMFNGKARIKLVFEKTIFKLKSIFEILKTAVPGTSQFFIESAGWMFLVRLVALEGSEAIAGYYIAFRVIVFTLLPAFGISHAAATLVGQNLGAGKPERAEQAVWRTTIVCMVFLFLASVVLYVWSSSIVSIFGNGQSIVNEIAEKGLKIVCLAYLFFAVGMVVVQSFNGSGDTKTPMFINIGAFWLFQIPFAYIMSQVVGLKETGVFLAIAFAHSIHAVTAFFLFRKGSWKYTRL